jgi:hypothetical protein
MKTFFFTLSLAFILATGAFAQKTQTRTLSAFTEISLKIGADIHLRQGEVQNVEVKGQEGTLNKLITEVSNRKLIVKYPSDTWFNKWNPGKVDIYITMPQIDELLILGSGSITADEKVDSRILNLIISGSGDIKFLELNSSKVSVAISGSGNVQLSGNVPAAEFKAVVSGSGNVKAIDFPANDVNVKIGGSGNCMVHAVKNLVARLAGSGNVIYRGQPLVDTAILGTGIVKKD